MGLLEDWGVSSGDNTSYTVVEQPPVHNEDDGEHKSSVINAFLAARRAKFAEEIKTDPTLALHLAAMQLTEGESDGGTIESLMNRADMSGKPIREMLGFSADGKRDPNSFYGPIRRGEIYNAIKQVEHNPALRAKFENYIQKALAGSHVIGGYTDQGMPTDPNGSARTGIHGKNIGGNEFVDFAGGPGGRAAAIAYRKFIEKNLGTDNPDAVVEGAPVPNVPGYHPRTGPRRAGSLPGLPYVKNEDGTYRLAEEGDSPNAMLYGPPRAHTKAQPDYIRSGIPGVQQQYVPPEMRGPFHIRPKALPIGEGSYTVGAPTVPPVFDSNSLVDASADLPGLPLDEAEPLAPEVANYLAKDAPNYINLKPSVPTPAPVPQNTINPDALVTASTQLPAINVDAPKVPMPQSRPEVKTAEAPVDVTKHASFNDLLESYLGPVRDTLADTKEGLRQAGVKAAGAVGSIPYHLAAGVAALPALAGYEGTLPAARWLHDQAIAETDRLDDLTGTPHEGKTPFQKTGAFAGSVYSPMGKYTALATGVNAGVVGLGNVIERANAMSIDRQNAENVLFPNAPTIMPADKRSGVGLDSFVGPLDPRIKVETSAGPAYVDGPNYRLLGYQGVATVGMLVAPMMAKAIISSAKSFGYDFLARGGRQLSNLPGDVKSFTTMSDVLHNVTHDRYATAMNTAKALHVDPVVLKDMRTKFDFQTGSATRALTNSFITTGEMNTTGFHLKVDTPIMRLAETEDLATTRYMYLHHTFDDLAEQQRIMLNRPLAVQQANPGPVTVRGMTLNDVRTEIRQMEASPEGPRYLDFKREYDSNRNEYWDTLYNGEYGTMSRQEYLEARTRRANNIYNKSLDLGNDHAVPEMVKSAESLGNEVQSGLRKRMENETIGTYIDTMVAQHPNFARRVSAEDYRLNQKSWEKNLVTFKRRGVKEYWLTDPTVAFNLRMDPYYMQGTASVMVNGPKNIVEMTTTGKFAPWFPFINASRNYNLARVSAENGFVAPNLIDLARSIPEQLLPQAAKVAAHRIDAWSNGYMGQMFPSVFNQAVSKKLMDVFDQSMYLALTKAGGVHSSGFLDYGSEAANSLRAASKSVPYQSARNFMLGLSHTLEAIHNSANFAYASKNIRKGGKSVEAAARSSKQLTGDPGKVGQFASNSKVGGSTTIPYSTEGLNPFQRAGFAAAKWGAGGAFEAGRQAFPWFNVTTQGMKRVGQSYTENPAKFVQRIYQTAVVPAAAVYMFNRGAGVDPNGVSYTDYEMNRRSPYKSHMYLYIAIPGLPAERGIEIPLPHETALPSSLIRAGLHHATHSEFMGRADDFTRAALSFVGMDYEPSDTVPLRSTEEDAANTMSKMGEIALVPALPPVIAGVMGAGGMVAPSGPFGETYRKRDDAFDDKQGLPTSLDLFLRGIGPGVADIAGSGIAAYMHSEHAFTGMFSGAKAMGKRMVEKTPFVNDVIGLKMPITGSTRTTEDFFEDKKTLDKIDEYYKKFDPTVDHSGKREKGSKQGRAIAEYFMGDQKIPQGNFGLENKEPVNMLYKAFAKELDRKLHKDVVFDKDGKTPAGGIGFVSQKAIYSELSEALKQLRKIDDGNNTKWREKLEQKPEIIEYLKEHNVPLDNSRNVRNFLELKRQDAAKQLMFTVRAIEQDFQRRLNDPSFRFEKLDPNQPYLLPPGIEIPEYVPTIPSYTDELGLRELAKPNHHKKKVVVQ